MPAAMVEETQFTEAKAHLSDVMDDVVHKQHLRAIRRKRDEVAYIVTPQMLAALAPTQRLSVHYLPEDDGTMSLWLDELKIGAHGDDLPHAREQLVTETMAYVRNYWGEFERYRHYPDRLALAPLVAAITATGGTDGVRRLLFGAGA